MGRAKLFGRTFFDFPPATLVGRAKLWGTANLFFGGVGSVDPPPLAGLPMPANRDALSTASCRPAGWNICDVCGQATAVELPHALATPNEKWNCRHGWPALTVYLPPRGFGGFGRRPNLEALEDLEGTHQGKYKQNFVTFFVCVPLYLCLCLRCSLFFNFGMICGVRACVFVFVCERFWMSPPPSISLLLLETVIALDKFPALGI